MVLGDIPRKERREAAAQARAVEELQRLEDLSWVDDDKHIHRRLERARLKEQKADLKITAKAERKALEASEAMTMLGKKANIPKVTQAEVVRRQALAAAAKAASFDNKKRGAVVSQPTLTANLNRVEGRIEATGIDNILASLDSLSTTSTTTSECPVGSRSISTTTGKPMTYQDFEYQTMQKLKEENPGLKKSQLIGRCRKMWERTPDFKDSF